MAMDYHGLRSLTARELIAALGRDGFHFVRQAARISVITTLMAGVTVGSHGGANTFTIKTLKSMIELQARWTAHDLKRLKVIR